MKRWISAILVGLTVMAAVWAAAASLTVTNDQLQAGGSAVTECDVDDTVTVAYNIGYDATDGRYEVTSADVSGISGGCVGSTISITLSDATNVSLAADSNVVAGASENLAFTTPTGADLVFNADVALS